MKYIVPLELPHQNIKKYVHVSWRMHVTEMGCLQKIWLITCTSVLTSDIFFEFYSQLFKFHKEEEIVLTHSVGCGTKILDKITKCSKKLELASSLWLWPCAPFLWSFTAINFLTMIYRSLGRHLSFTTTLLSDFFYDITWWGNTPR